MNWVKVEVSVPDKDFITQIRVNNKKLCLIRHESKLHAVQNNCPHAGGILSGGWCKDGHVICPIHRYEYNLENGRGAEGQGDYIRVYPVELRQDGIYVGFKEGLWQRFFGRR